jgi:hypothetical protein
MIMETTLDILPLENGDRPTRSEFESRYKAMPHVKKAEFIEGANILSGEWNSQLQECSCSCGLNRHLGFGLDHSHSHSIVPGGLEVMS